jgi:hypothetical protein
VSVAPSKDKIKDKIKTGQGLLPQCAQAPAQLGNFGSQLSVLMLRPRQQPPQTGAGAD